MSTESHESQIESLLGQMTVEEKVQMCHAVGNFHSGGCRRLGIPELCMSDGPHGVRFELDRHSWNPIQDREYDGTYLPTGTSLAATWNPDLARQFGQVLGAEARQRGKDVILGPGINIIRTPLCGRNFEYFSEDPHLIAQLVVPVVEGIQSQSTACCVKHYALNNQELDRHGVDVHVEERPLREIYLKGFMAAARAGAWTFMGAYNLYRGQHCCHNQRLLNEILKGQWAWDGVVISDWGGTYDTIEAAECGLDIEMGGGADYDKYHLSGPLLEAIRSGRVDMAVVDDKVRRILRLMFRLGLLGETDRPSGARNTEAHRQTALDIARESVVLLKNDADLLPLKPESLRKVVVIGENATARHGRAGGSSQVPAAYEITPLEGIRQILGDEVDVQFVQGYPDQDMATSPIPAQQLGVVEAGSGVRGWKAEFFTNGACQGPPAVTKTAADVNFGWGPCDLPGGLRPGQIEKRWSVRMTAELVPEESGLHEFVLQAFDYAHLLVDGEAVMTLWGKAEQLDLRTAKIELTAGQSYQLEVQQQGKFPEGRTELTWIPPSKAGRQTSAAAAEAIQAASDADAVIFIGGLNHSFDTEGADRKSLHLSHGQDELIRELAAVNDALVVVLVAGSAVAMDWLDQVPALIWSGYNGMEAGRALAEVLFGRTNPSGKLPYTLPAKLTDVPAHALEGAYQASHVSYAEGLLVGYRWFDTKHIEPLFPFGHGLSYTRHEMSDLSVEGLRVSLTLRNVGDRDGAEVVQLYVSRPGSRYDRPVRELKAFAKVALPAGESRDVTFQIDPDDLAVWDQAAEQWVLEPGLYGLAVGSSSRRIALEGSVKI